MKTNSITLVFYDSLVAKTNTETRLFLRVVFPSLYYLHGIGQVNLLFNKKQVIKQKNTVYSPEPNCRGEGVIKQGRLVFYYKSIDWGGDNK